MSRFNPEPRRDVGRVQGENVQVGDGNAMFGPNANIGNYAPGQQITQNYHSDEERLSRMEALLRRLQAGVFDQNDEEEVIEVLQQEVARIRRSQR